jgi:hypothetical protein
MDGMQVVPQTAKLMGESRRQVLERCRRRRR